MTNTYDPSKAISDAVAQFNNMFPMLGGLAEKQASAISLAIDKAPNYESIDEFMADKLYQDIFSRTSKAYKGAKAISGNIGSGSLPAEVADLATETAAKTFLPISQFREGQRQFNLSARPSPASLDFVNPYLDAEKTRFITESNEEAEKARSKAELYGSLGGMAGAVTQSVLQPYFLSKFLKPSVGSVGTKKTNDLLAGGIMGSIAGR